MADPLHNVMMTAAELKLMAPREYDKFIEAMKAFETRCMNDLVAAADNVIFPAQGKAQIITQLRQKLENCHQLKADYEARS